MHRRNYTQEVGLAVPEARVPALVAGVALATASVALWFSVRDMQARADRYHEASRLTTAAEKATQPTLARK